MGALAGIATSRVIRKAAHPLRAVSAARYRAWTKWHGLDLAVETNEQTGVPATMGTYHASSGGPDLRAAIKTFGLRPTSVLDIGCGKGGALIEFHRLGFRPLGGVEYSNALIAACKSNLRALGIPAALRAADAATFTNFAPYNLIYMYNALGDDCLARTLANLCAGSGSRAKLLLVRNPLHHAWVRPGIWPIGEFVRDDRYSLFEIKATELTRPH